MARSLLLGLLFATFAATLVAQEPAAEVAEEDLREWTDTTGQFQIDARFVDYAKNEVTLQLADGKTIKVPLARLSADDRAFIRAEMRRRRDAEKAAAENPAAGETPAEPADPPMGNPEHEPIRPAAVADHRGLGILPLEKPAPFVHVEGMPAPKPEDCVRSRWADPDKDPQRLIDAEAQRLLTAGERHKELEQKFAPGLVRVETHHVVVHAQFAPAEAQKIGLSLEALKVHLHTLTGSMLLTPLRPDGDELIIAADKPSYLRLLKVMEAENAGNLGDSWHLMPQVAGGTVGRSSVTFVQPQPELTPHMAVAMIAGRSIAVASKGRAPYWLRTGFSAYGENIVFGKNLTSSVKYQLNERPLDDDWALAAKRLAAAGVLKPWNDIMGLDLQDYGPVDHVQSYAMTAFLLQSDPQKFLDMTELMAGGTEPAAAIAKAYGKPIEELQQVWLQWLVRA